MKDIVVLRLDDTYVDANGDIMPTTIGITMKNPIPVTLGYDQKKIVGWAELVRRGNTICANMAFTPEYEQSLSMSVVYPAVGGQIAKRKGQVVLECSIDCVSLGNHNVDALIPSLKDQLKTKKEENNK